MENHNAASGGQSIGSKVMQSYKNYSEADKAALRELQAYASAKVGSDVKISDILAAVEPGIETPEFLKAA